MQMSFLNIVGIFFYITTKQVGIDVLKINIQGATLLHATQYMRKISPCIMENHSDFIAHNYVACNRIADQMRMNLKFSPECHFTSFFNKY